MLARHGRALFEEPVIEKTNFDAIFKAVYFFRNKLVFPAVPQCDACRMRLYLQQDYILNIS